MTMTAPVVNQGARREVLRRHLMTLPRVGETKAENIIEWFGGVDNTIQIMDADPLMLIKVPGVSFESAQKIATSWVSRRRMLDAELRKLEEIGGK